MNTIPSLHVIQRGILNNLLYVERAKFGVLRPSEVSTDHFSYHLQQLTKEGLITRESDGYSLTELGKQLASLIDTETDSFEQQAKLGVMLVVLKDVGGVTQVLMQQRLKHPFFGFWGFPTGKIRVGETPHQAALRELHEETGLRGESAVTGVAQRRNRDSEDGHLLEEEFFFVVCVHNPEGELTESAEGVQHQWVDEREIETLEPQFPALQRVLDLALLAQPMAYDFDEANASTY